MNWPSMYSNIMKHLPCSTACADCTDLPTKITPSVDAESHCVFLSMLSMMITCLQKAFFW